MNTACICSHDCLKLSTAQISAQLTDMTDDHIRHADAQLIAFTAHLLYSMHTAWYSMYTCSTEECGLGWYRYTSHSGNTTSECENFSYRTQMSTVCICYLYRHIKKSQSQCDYLSESGSLQRFVYYMITLIVCFHHILGLAIFQFSQLLFKKMCQICLMFSSPPASLSWKFAVYFRS